MYMNLIQLEILILTFIILFVTVENTSLHHINFAHVFICVCTCIGVCEYTPVLTSDTHYSATIKALLG